MTDTNEVNLTALEQGDEVLYGKSKSKCLVNKVEKIDAFKLLVVIYKYQTSTLIAHHYDKNGINQTGGVDIVQIIKNPKRWSDKDMESAFNATKTGQSPRVHGSMKFQSWLEHYKLVNHGQ